MKTIRPLHEVATACGNVLRGHVEVNGREYQIESDGEKWVHIIDDGARCETCVIDGTDVVSDGGEHVTEDWTDEDWEQFNAFVLEPNPQ